jgi:hypothetical protein
MGIKASDPVLAKLGDDEPIFILRAQDITSPLIVLDWIRQNFMQVPEHKLREAFEQAIVMKNYEDKKIPD